MIDKELIDKLEKIGYTTLWMEYGVLTIEQLSKHEHTINNVAEHNNEHYRYQTLRNYLSSKTNLSDNEFENYLELIFLDNDTLMAGSAAVDLFTYIELTDLQFEKLCIEICRFGVWTEKIIKRQTLLRQLKLNKLTTKLFNECLENGDTVIHEFILEVANLEQLRAISINGKNKRIRNIASDKIKRLKIQ